MLCLDYLCVVKTAYRAKPENSTVYSADAADEGKATPKFPFLLIAGINKHFDFRRFQHTLRDNTKPYFSRTQSEN